jgi:Zn-dependent protease with chaperone function
MLLDGTRNPAEAQSPPAPRTAPSPYDAALAQPLSRETWPVWRETYIRTFYEDFDGQNRQKEKRFYEHVRGFFYAAAAASGGSLPKEFADDPMAWAALAWAHVHVAGGEGLLQAGRQAELARAEEASRKGIALGDPQAMPSYSRAVACVIRARFLKSEGGAISEIQRGLGEAEERLRHVEQVSPRANINLYRGQIAALRGDMKQAEALFRKAVEDHPRSAYTAATYLEFTMLPGDSPGKLAERTGTFLARFPSDPAIQAFHAAALYRDERYAEAAETLRRARQQDERVARILGEAGVKAIEQGRELTADAVEGLRAMKARQYQAAAGMFRRELLQNPGNATVARFLAQALAHQLLSSPRPSAAIAGSTASEIRDLSRRFPSEAEIQAALAATLHGGGRNIEAAQALKRAEQSGADPRKLFDAESLQSIQQDALYDETVRTWQTVAIAGVVGACLWIGVMFAMGAILAICIPRVPKSMALTGRDRSGPEIWLERFYLLVLSLGLLGFYVSVPVVAAGLLAVTLCLFGLLLAIRILHFGILQRGLWAFGNVLRCTLIGPQGEVLGIQATSQEHPRLFETLRAVAHRLETRPVDTVYLTPSSNISVKQEGSGPFGLLGKRRRVLEIGISTLPLLSREEFQSILAHEYGHFSRNDTFYGRFIFQVSASLAISLAVMSAAGGILNYINPFYWFWWFYLRAYTLLANGFSRSREFLADRHAAAAYGKQAFVSGLTKVSVDGVLFESTVYSNIRQLLSQGKAFTNAFGAFRHFRDGTEIVQSRERLLDHMRQTKPKWLDTHPTFSERLAAISDFPDLAPTGDTEPAIELLSDPQAVEAKLTDLLTGYVHEAMSRTGGYSSEPDPP